MCCPISFSRRVSRPEVLMKGSMSLAPAGAPLRVAEAPRAELFTPDLGAALAADFADFAVFFAAYLLSSVTLAMVVSHVSITGHVGPADRVLRTSERHHGERRGFHGERCQVFGLETVYIGLAAGTRHHLSLDRQAMEEVVDALRGAVGIETLAQHRVLSGDPDRAAAGVAVIAVARLDADLLLVVGLGDVLVAVERHECRVTDRDRIGPERERLSEVAAVTDATGIYE